MRVTKWIFFAYLGLVVLVIGAIAISFGMTPQRDPETMYTAYGSNIKTLDPGAIGDTTSSGVAGNIFECLYNYDYEARPFKLIPELAAELPEISDDGKTVTIKLRKGIHFCDPEGNPIPGFTPITDVPLPADLKKATRGPEIKAKDFIYSWKRIANFHLASQNYSAMFEGKIVGLEEFREYTKKTPPDQVDWDRPVEGLEAVDDYTIRIKLIKPDPQLRYNLAHLPTAAVSRAAAEFHGKNFRHHPIGSGPYVLKEHLPEQRITFLANPIYRGKADIDGTVQLPPDEKMPYIKRLQIDYFNEDLSQWAVFQQGLLDINGIPKDAFAQAIDNSTRNLSKDLLERGITLKKEPYPAIWFYGFNMEDPIVGKNKPLRHAISMAFDRPKYVDLFANGRGQPAIGPIPPGFPIFDPNLKNPYTEFNVEGAKAKLKEAEAIHGGPIPTLRFLLPGTDTAFRQMGDFMNQQMGQIGIKLNVEYVTWARFQEMIDAKQAQMYALGWVADYPDEQTFLQLFYSKNAAPGPNSANYSNPEYDALYEKASVMNPGPERDELYRKMQQITMEDCPWLLNFYSISYTLYYDWVENFGAAEYMHGARKHYKLNSEKRRSLMRH